MNPDTVHDPEPEHDHEHKRAAVTDQRQRNSRNRQQRNGHPDVLKNVRKNERRDSNNQKQPELITREEGDKKTGQEQQRESADAETRRQQSPTARRWRRRCSRYVRRSRAESPVRSACSAL